MAKTSLIAVHRIGVGKPKGDGTISYVEPGKPFEIESDEAAALIASGAAKLAPQADAAEEPAKPAKKAGGKKAPAPAAATETKPETETETKPETEGDADGDGDDSGEGEGDGDDTDLM